MNPIIQMKNISFSYHRQDDEIKALENISFDVKKGDFISIVGPSGCGKSTILSILAGLIQAESGTLIKNPDLKFGYMFQQDLLLPYATIWKNVTLGLNIQHKETLKNHNYVSKLLYKYGLDRFENKYPSQLSGGMRQRAALIRTLALKPDVLLLDEPFSALDYQTRLLVADDIGNIIRKEGKTAILVTHDLSEAISLSDKIVILSNRPSRVVDIMRIDISNKEKGSLYVRNQKEFGDYFQILWKEMNTQNEQSA